MKNAILTPCALIPNMTRNLPCASIASVTRDQGLYSNSENPNSNQKLKKINKIVLNNRHFVIV